MDDAALQDAWEVKKCAASSFTYACHMFWRLQLFLTGLNFQRITIGLMAAKCMVSARKVRFDCSARALVREGSSVMWLPKNHVLCAATQRLTTNLCRCGHTLVISFSHLRSKATNSCCYFGLWEMIRMAVGSLYCCWM
jgi:hypothetical protein